MHDVADAGQQFTAQATAGVVTGKVHGLELNGVDQCHGQGIAHGHGRQGRRGRGQVIRAHFALDRDVQPDIRVLGQGRLAVTGHGDDFVAKGLQARDQLDQFIGFAAVADQDQHVDGLEHAQVAVEGFSRVQEETRGAGGGEGRDHLFPDQAGFAHATHDGAAFAAEDELDGILEFTIQAAGQLSDSLRLGNKGFFSDSEVIHVLTFVLENNVALNGQF
ncbi:hypothetical protein D3C84_417720 [compost metagenome]